METKITACTFESLNKVWGDNNPESQLFFNCFEVVTQELSDGKTIAWHIFGHNHDKGYYMECLSFGSSYDARIHNLVTGSYYRK
jgi:hypothetical protein